MILPDQSRPTAVASKAFVLCSAPMAGDCVLAGAPTLKSVRIHPVPRKRIITIQFGTDGRNPSLEAQALLGISGKELRHLPHVFSRVLELSFRSDTDVVICLLPIQTINYDVAKLGGGAMSGGRPPFHLSPDRRRRLVELCFCFFR
ncbi:hypothetical protein TSUD_401270 [Trifolium subterraneum]|uniref:Uncharacterized protein n=1 Tax=Trifolium subterraneum TaxID=3900 RepID=A0A2Z6PL83_TRISU|nr:hypothetical protein TSUD_401270 [Trifolium subterraneum]